MSRRLFTPTFIVLLLVYAAVAILALTSAEWYKSAMTPSGPVRVGVLDYYPPFSFRDGSARRGFDVDIAGAICLRMNRPCEFVPLSFVDLIPALQDGRIDAIVAGLNDTARRNRSAAFSTPYYRSRSFFISKHPWVTDLVPAKTAGLRIGVMKSSLQKTGLDAVYKPFGANIIEFGSYADMILALDNDEIDVLYTDGLAGYQLLRSDLGQAFYIADYAYEQQEHVTEARIAVRRGETALLQQINTALTHLQLTEEYHDIAMRYFPYFTF